MEPGIQAWPVVDIAALSQLDDPYPEFDRLREVGPIHRGVRPGTWVVVSHREISEILADRERFSAQLDSEKPSIWEVEGCRHGRLRGEALADLLPKRVRELGDWIERETEGLVEQLDPRKFDVVASLAEPLTTRVIARVLGIADFDDGVLQIWASPHGIERDPEPAGGGPERLESFKLALHRRVAERALENPNGLVCRLVAGGASDGKMALADATSVMSSLLFAAVHTTQRAITHAVHQTVLRPALWKRLPICSDTLQRSVEESLRIDPPGFSAQRRVLQRTKVGHQWLEANDQVFLMLGAANHDADYVPEPHRFDIHRRQRGNLAFGRGRHHCVGAALVRPQLHASLKALATRFPRLRLTGEKRRIRSARIRGFEQLELSAQTLEPSFEQPLATTPG